ncbi:dynein axonemal heavy chain 8-like [Mobula hypostoma]|uniref:dynein axonemal heavy chain 8-like n=1 Tax=Mobula hypostoma TaxID=723540 RepID=UPI002FC33D28
MAEIFDAHLEEFYEYQRNEGNNRSLGLFAYYEEGGTKTSLENAVVLKSEKVDLSQLRSFEQIRVAASNPEMVLQLENLLLKWHNQLELVLAQSNQVRKEAEGSGPLTELEYWKCTSAQFNSIIEELKGQHCKAVINVLNISQSKLIKMWQGIDSEITDAANAAKDNVKFLQALEQVCQPLYNSDPVTNQMVTACKAYITQDGTVRVWDQDYETVINKMQECKKLLVEYRRYFQNTKKHATETAQDNPFDLSEMYIFGKLEVFCKRMAKITAMVNTVKTFSALQHSTIEGIEILAIKFHNICLNLKKSHYDILDPRKKEFNADHAVFMKQISDLESLIDDFMDSCFAKIISSQQALHLLKRFQNLNMPSLESELDVTIERIIHHYSGELMFIKKHYQEKKEDPPLARNMPPLAGKILWARQLFQRLHEPIDYFYKNSDILKSPRGKSTVRKYNKIAYVLVKFEMLYYKAWKKEILTMQYVLQTPLLVRDPETGKMSMNFDHRITEVLREAKCMLKMGLEVPEIAKRLLKNENTLIANYNSLEYILQKFEYVCQGTPPEFLKLIAPKIKKIESILRQGITVLNWSSVTLKKFFSDANTAIDELVMFLKTLADLWETQINGELAEIASKIIIHLPEDYTLTMEDMLQYNEVCCKEWTVILFPKGNSIEKTVNKLVELFTEISDRARRSITPENQPVFLNTERRRVVFTEEPEEEKITSYSSFGDDVLSHRDDDFEKDVTELYAHFSRQLLDALVKSTHLSLEIIKRRIFNTYGRRGQYGYLNNVEEFAPFLKVEVHLAIPNVILVPNLDEIQYGIKRTIQMILEVNRKVHQWRQSKYHHDGTYDTLKMAETNEIKSLRKPKNFYHSVAEHKDVTKLVVMLSASVDIIKKAIMSIQERFQKFNKLWLQDRDPTVKKFMEGNPSLYELRTKIEYYAALQQDIEEINSTITKLETMEYDELSKEDTTLITEVTEKLENTI